MIELPSILSSEVFGAHQINQMLAFESIESEEQFYNAYPGDVYILSPIDSEEEFGTPQLNYIIEFIGIPSEEFFFNIVIPGATIIFEDGIASHESFGQFFITITSIPAKFTITLQRRNYTFFGSAE